MNKVIKNSLITILIAILVFVIVYFVYDIIKVKPINMEQAKQNNTDGPNEGLDTNKLFEKMNQITKTKMKKIMKKKPIIIQKY